MRERAKRDLCYREREREREIVCVCVCVLMGGHAVYMFDDHLSYSLFL